VADVTAAAWRKSSYSGNGTQQNGCVAVARCRPGVVAVRDSKDPHGPELILTPAGWLVFTSKIKG
jgi:hypothetical protein